MKVSLFNGVVVRTNIEGTSAPTSCKKFDSGELTLPPNSAVLRLPPQSLLWNQKYNFVLHITKDSREAQEAVFIKATEGLSLPYAAISLMRRGSNIKDSVNPHEELVFSAITLSKTPDQLTYRWNFPGFSADALDGSLDRRDVKLKSWQSIPGSTFEISVLITDSYAAQKLI